MVGNVDADFPNQPDKQFDRIPKPENTEKDIYVLQLFGSFLQAFSSPDFPPPFPCQAATTTVASTTVPRVSVQVTRCARKAPPSLSPKLA